MEGEQQPLDERLFVLMKTGSQLILFAVKPKLSLEG